jgi:hypothetical protein
LKPLFRDAIQIECKIDKRFKRPTEFDKLQEEQDAVREFLGGMDGLGDSGMVSAPAKVVEKVEEPLGGAKGVCEEPANPRDTGRKSETPFLVCFPFLLV